MSTTSTLSRRTLVASAAALPALAVPTVVSAVPARAASTTLPPDLIERFVRVRAWYLDYCKQEKLEGDEIDRRFYAATGLTEEQWEDLDRDHPRWEEFDAVRSKTIREVLTEESETECEQLCDERWRAAEAIFDHAPQTIADLAWQAEAFLIADLEIYQGLARFTSERLIRTLFRYIRTLGALPQPNDPLGALSLDISSDDDGDCEEPVATTAPALVGDCTGRPDPIFAAIERHRQAEAAFGRAFETTDQTTAGILAAEDKTDEFGEVSSEAYADLVCMTPRTVAGCAALLRHVEEHENEYDRPALFGDFNPERRVYKAGSNLLSRVASVLEVRRTEEVRS